jgi:hypothetical protein
VLFAVLMCVWVTLAALFVGSIVGAIILFTQYPISDHGHGYIVGYGVLGTLAFAWLLHGTVIVPHQIRSKRRPVQDVVREGDLFDAAHVETKFLANFIGKDLTCEHRLLVERDGARIHVASPVRATRVLHRLGTHIAIAFDEHGGAHEARAWNVS